jgi:hypothetical protein
MCDDIGNKNEPKENNLIFNANYQTSPRFENNNGFDQEKGYTFSDPTGEPYYSTVEADLGNLKYFNQGTNGYPASIERQNNDSGIVRISGSK